MRKLQSTGARLAPGRIRGTKLEEEIITLHLFKKWSAKRVVEHLDNFMVTENTVYGVCSRFRKRMQKLDDEATSVRDRIVRGMEAAQEPDAEEHFPVPGKSGKSQRERKGEVPPASANQDSSYEPLSTEEVFGLAATDPDSVALADKGEDPASLRRRHREFLSIQAETASQLVENTGRAALTSTKSAESSEASLRWIKAYQASIQQFKVLAGLDDDPEPGTSGLHIHAHLYQGRNPYLDA